jgi:hypothetical protein
MVIVLAIEPFLRWESKAFGPASLLGVCRNQQRTLLHESEMIRTQMGSTVDKRESFNVLPLGKAECTCWESSVSLK